MMKSSVYAPFFRFNRRWFLMCIHLRNLGKIFDSSAMERGRKRKIVVRQRSKQRQPMTKWKLVTKCLSLLIFADSNYLCFFKRKLRRNQFLQRRKANFGLTPCTSMALTIWPLLTSSGSNPLISFIIIIFPLI
jgi:hypothetical protein